MPDDQVDARLPVVVNGEIWDRNDFGTLCEWRMLYRAVEVGVDRGEFAQAFLTKCYNCSLYLGVDPYSGGPEYSEMVWPRESDFMAACIKFEKFSSKAKMIRATSQEAARAIGSSTSMLYNASTPYDFVYIDASHVKADVAADLELWWPLVSSNGVLAGHDWSMMSGDHGGVREAVTEFAKKNNVAIHVTWKDDPTSWYVFRDGAARPYAGRGA